MTPALSEAGTEALRHIPPAPIRLGKPPACLLMDAIDEWLDHMRLRRKKPKSIEAFKQIAYRAMRESGWRDVSDLTHDNITAWIARASRESNWKAATINHRMTALHSLTERLYKRGLLAHDPLADAIRADETDSGEGARAGTLEEARAIILRAWIKEQSDKRCKGARALYWACLFGLGCRLDEPARWRWKHLCLEMNPPRVCWEPSINKGKKRREQPIPAWLASRLLEHRSRVPHDLEDAVFPVIPNKATFAQDREAAGIPFEDYRGRKFTPHAARKFYSTFLTGAGVSEKMVDFLMRHQGGVEGRYYDPPREECAAAVAKIPNLWPDVTPGDSKSFRPNDCGPKDLREGGEKSFTNAVASDASCRYSPAGASEYSHTELGRSPPTDAPPRLRNAAAGFGGQSGKAGSSVAAQYEPVFGNTGLQQVRDANALADFLESLARLLRSQGASDEQRASGMEAAPEVRED